MKVIAEGVTPNAMTVVLGAEAGQWVVSYQITECAWASVSFDALQVEQAWERFRNLAAAYIDARNAA